MGAGSKPLRPWQVCAGDVIGSGKRVEYVFERYGELYINASDEKLVRQGKRDSSGRTRAGGGLRMEGIPMQSAGISTSDRERTGIREGALFSCRICRMYGVYGSPACWYAGLLYL